MFHLADANYHGLTWQLRFLNAVSVQRAGAMRCLDVGVGIRFVVTAMGVKTDGVVGFEIEVQVGLSRVPWWSASE